MAATPCDWHANIVARISEAGDLDSQGCADLAASFARTCDDCEEAA